MSTRKTIILASLLSAMALPAFANSGTTTLGNAGFQFHPMPSTVTRAQVQQELAEWRKNPVTADGYRDVGGEQGWEYVGHRFESRDGRFVHVDALPHNLPKPSITMTGQERAAWEAQYSAGG